LWQSQSGRTFVSVAGGGVWRFAPRVQGTQSAAPVFDELPAAIAGVWGVDSNCVFAWGELGNEPKMFQWGGVRWDEIASPGKVNAVHGTARDFVYAVGADGLIARWEGAGWTTAPSPTKSMLSSVFVASQDEMYAVGAGGSVLEGSLYGWSEVLVRDSQLYAVAKWKDKVWVAGGPDGLFTLAGNKLAPYRPDVTAERFDARGTLLISAKTEILEPAEEEKKFRSSGLAGFIKLAEPLPAAWEEGT
jgi:hypothetical protein